MTILGVSKVDNFEKAPNFMKTFKLYNFFIYTDYLGKKLPPIKIKCMINALVCKVHLFLQLFTFKCVYSWEFKRYKNGQIIYCGTTSYSELDFNRGYFFYTL